jgi:AcrR family transcriptional regulator
MITTVPRAIRLSGAPADAADRIVRTTLRAIERDGLDALTVRRIARDAGVNIAAINYYFRSKDDLVTLVLERAADRSLSDPLIDFDRLVAEGKDARVALAAAVERVLETAVEFPRTAMAQLHGPVVLQDYRRDIVVRTNALLDRFFARLRKRLVGRSDAQKRATLAQLWSVVTMTSLAPMLLRPFARIDLRDAKQRGAWVKALVDRSVEAPKARAGGRSRSESRSGAGSGRGR